MSGTRTERAERVHVMREHSARPGAFRLICGASQREEHGWVLDIEHVAEPGRWGSGGVTERDFGAVNCPDCLAILDREARAAA